MAATKGRNLRLELPSGGTLLTLPDFVKHGDPFDECSQVDHEDSGAHGDVYQVALRDGSVKAVKVMDARPSQSAEILEVLKEAEIGLQMKHTHLLPIEQVWYDGTKFFLVMDLVKPLTEENLPQSLKDRLALFQQLVSAVEHLNSIGLLHRDIKVQNCGIKVDEDGKQRLVLFDFGEACKVSDYYRNCVGTILHIAPEVLENCQYSDKSEIWALMSFLIEMLTGKPMILHFFLAGKASRFAVESKISELTEPPIPEVFKTDKSRAGILLLQILRRGLAINPAERLTFPELESLLQELIALL